MSGVHQLPQPAVPHTSALWESCGLLVLAVFGHVCALRLTDVKPYAVYQHLQPWTWIVSERPWPVWGALIQAVMVAAAAWRLRRVLLAAISHVLSPGRLLVFLGLAAFALAVPTVSVTRFAGELVLAGGLAVIAALNLVLAALALPDGMLTRATTWIDERLTLRPGDPVMRRWDRALPGVVALIVGALAAIASFVVFERVPHIDDSVSYYFQAKYFAAGHLFLPPPPDVESFQVNQVITEPTKWYGYGFPAWPATLALGVRLGVPWLVNPFLGALLVLVGHALIRRRYDRGTANAAVLLLALSPWLIFMSAEFMPHPLTAVLALLVALAFDHATDRQYGGLRWAVLAGLATGALTLTRGIDAVLIVVPVGLAVVLEGRLRRALSAIVTAGVVAGLVASAALPYNQALTGRATYPPHEAWSDRHWGPGVDRIGFGADIGIPEWRNLDPLPGHGLPDVILNANKNVFMTNVDLFGWACGSLLFVWLALLGPRRPGDVLMLAIPGAVVAGYSAYWFSGGPDLGARYWYPVLVPLAVLTIRGAQDVSTGVRERGGVPNAGARVAALMVAASVSAGITVVPWRAVTKYYHYRGIGGEIRALAAAQRFDHALVFVRSDIRSDYQAAFNLNSAMLDDAGPIYALDAGAAHRAIVVAYFRTRPVWVIAPRRDPRGRRAFEVIAGPLPPGTVP